MRPAYDKRLFGADYMEFLSTVVPVHHVRRIDNNNNNHGASQRNNHFASVKTQELIESFRPNRLGELHPSNGSLILGRYVLRLLL